MFDGMTEAQKARRKVAQKEIEKRIRKSEKHWYKINEVDGTRVKGIMKIIESEVTSNIIRKEMEE